MPFIMSAIQEPVPIDEPPKKKRRETPGKPRAPARPYQRLDSVILDTRMKDLVKTQMAVLRSKLVLLEDRYEGHENESTLRASEKNV